MTFQASVKGTLNTGARALIVPGYRNSQIIA